MDNEFETFKKLFFYLNFFYSLNFIFIFYLNKKIASSLISKFFTKFEFYNFSLSCLFVAVTLYAFLNLTRSLILKFWVFNQIRLEVDNFALIFAIEKPLHINKLKFTILLHNFVNNFCGFIISPVRTTNYMSHLTFIRIGSFASKSLDKLSDSDYFRQIIITDNFENKSMKIWHWGREAECFIMPECPFRFYAFIFFNAIFYPSLW